MSDAQQKETSLKERVIAKLNQLMSPLKKEVDELQAQRDALIESIQPTQAKIDELALAIKSKSPELAQYKQMRANIEKPEKRIGNMPTSLEVIAKHLNV